MKRKLTVAVLAAATVLALSACTGTNSTQPTASTPVVSGTPVATPTGPVDAYKYNFIATTAPDVTFGLQLLSGTKFVNQTAKNGLVSASYQSCGVVFLNTKTVTADHLLTSAEQITQSNNWITEYAKKVGGAAQNVVNGTLNTTETIPGRTTTYSIDTREATFHTSKYDGIVESRIFADGTGVAVTFLCSQGQQVPDVATDVRITTSPLPTPTATATVTPSSTATTTPAAQ